MKYLTIIISILMSTTLFAQLEGWKTPSARASAMGGAFTAIANDAWAGYYNPAGLAKMEKPQFGVAYNQLFSIRFLKTYFAAGALPVNAKYGTVGFSMDYFGVDYKGESLSSETSFTLSHGINVFKDYNTSLSIGYNVRLFNWSLGTSRQFGDLGSVTKLGVDVGFQASLYDRTYIGFAITNINGPSVGKIESHDLTQKMVIGLAYKPYSNIVTVFDIKKDIGTRDMQYWAGAEVEVNKFLVLRSGAMVNPNRFTFGLGVHVSKLIVDYAILTHPEISESHQFGIRMMW